MPPRLPLEDDGQRVHQETVYALLELVEDQERDEERPDRPHQSVAQLDQVIQKRHPAFFEFAFPVVVHNRSLNGPNMHRQHHERPPARNDPHCFSGTVSWLASCGRAMVGTAGSAGSVSGVSVAGCGSASGTGVAERSPSENVGSCGGFRLSARLPVGSIVLRNSLSRSISVAFFSSCRISSSSASRIICSTLL